MKGPIKLRPFRLLVYLLFPFLIAACENGGTVNLEDTFWEVSNPQKEGLNADSLNKAVNAASQLANFYALLVVKNGKIVTEEYFKGKGPQSIFHLRSITKNFTSALAGIALDQGFIDDIDAPVKPYFPDKITDDKQAITMRHLLNMASGFTWSEDDEIVDLIEHRIPKLVDYLLDRELSEVPGTVFNYNSLSPHLVAKIIGQTTGGSFKQYAEHQLLEPLGITDYVWNLDPEGRVWAGFGLQLKARDLAKFGLLYINKGIWEDQQIVPENWVIESSNPQIDISGSTSKYSQQWWVTSNLETPVFFGLGYGGQALMLLPDKDLLIIALQEHFVQTEEHSRQWQNFTEKVFKPIFNGIN